MNNTNFTKWDLNREFYFTNLARLWEIYPGKIIFIIGEEVRYAVEGVNGWEHVLEILTPEERLEAYHVYIPRKNEAIVI